MERGKREGIAKIVILSHAFLVDHCKLISRYEKKKNQTLNYFLEYHLKINEKKIEDCQQKRSRSYDRIDPYGEYFANVLKIKVVSPRYLSNLATIFKVIKF